jgi:hypothetical protein
MDRCGGPDDSCHMTTDISLAGESAEYEVEATFEERVIDVATDYETMIAECVSELGLPP